MNQKTLLAVTLTFAAVLVGKASFAESFADRMPADAVGYMEWAGVGGNGKAYETSRFKQFIEAVNLPQLISQKMQEDLESKASDPQKAAETKLFQKLITAVSKSPTGVYFGPVDFADSKQPVLKVVVFSKIGAASAGEFAPQLNERIQRNHKAGDQAASAVVAGDFLVLNIGKETDIGKRLTGAAPAENLASVAAYKDALAQVDAATSQPAAMVYINGEAALKILDDAVAAKGDPRGMWPKFEEGMHLNAFHQIAWAGRFDRAGNWTDKTFVSLSAQRSGLAAFFDHKPLDPETLKSIPKSATYAAVERQDLLRLHDDLRNMAEKMDADKGGARFDKVLEQIYAYTGVNPKTELAENLSDTYVIYTTADSTGSSLRGITMLNKVKDGAKMEATLTTLETTINAMLAQRNLEAKYQFKSSPLPAPSEKVTAHAITLEKYSPAWAVANNTLYVAASTTALQSAVEGPKGTLSENPQFAALVKQLGQEKFGSFTYIDWPQVAKELYPVVSEGIAKDPKNKASAVPYALPPLDKITPTLTPALSVSWTDAEGYHAKSIGPFPMSAGLSPRFVVVRVMRAFTQHRMSSIGRRPAGQN